NLDGGVLLSTKRINAIVYDEGSQTVRVGLGNTWGDLYGYLESLNRITPGGRSLTVGLATIMGGTQWFVPIIEFTQVNGFVADRVLGFELIDASSNLVFANATKNEDLFFALKAGATTFGVLLKPPDS
ncbi:hypothetical protein BU26DRAFT_423882, partial [Trematosphaeria pertusa]